MIKNCFIVSLVICFTHSFGQTKNQFHPVVNKINEYLINRPQEKIHVHFDKQNYLVNDTIWFQAYAVNAIDNKPSDRSVFLYVDLINIKDSLCKSLQIPLNFGFASGDIPLVDKFSPGLYRIRAYTSLMKNGGGKFLFNKLIYIENSVSESNSLSYIQPADYSTFKEKLKNDVGYELKLDNTKPDSLYLTIFTNSELLNKEELALIPLSNGKPLFVFNTRISEQEIHLTIPKNKLPDGIINFALFNADNELITQKMVFNAVRNRGYLNLNHLESVYKKNEEIHLDMEVSDWLGKPVIGSFSVSITNADVIPVTDINESTIYSSLLLEADFENGVEYANYYLDKPLELDNLLSSKSWERPLWSNSSPEPLNNINHFANLSGRVLNQQHKNIRGAEVTLFPAEAGSGTIMSTLTDSLGIFRFNIPDSLLYGSFVIKAKTKKMQELEIELDKDIPLAIEPIKRYVLDSTIAIEQSKFVTIKNKKEKSLINSAGINLKDVEIRDYNPRPKLVNSHSLNLNGPGQADKVFTEKDLEQQINWTILLSTPGLKSFPMPDSPVGKIYLSQGAPKVPVLVLIDGMTGSLDLVSVHDVESVEVLKNVAYTSIYGIRGAGGVIVVTTKKGNKKYDSPPSKNITTFKFPIVKEDIFNTNNKTNSNSTLFWKPDLITDQNGKASFSFRNNNISGNYRMIIEGISTSGILFRKQYFYKVE